MFSGRIATTGPRAVYSVADVGTTRLKGLGRCKTSKIRPTRTDHLPQSHCTAWSSGLCNV